MPTDRSPAPVPATRASLVAWLTVGAVTLICLTRLAGLALDASVNVIYGDAWDFLAPLFDSKGPLDCFLQQHGPHRQGLGGLLQWALYSLFAWDSRVEVWCMVGLLFAATLLLVTLSARLRGHLAASDAVFPLVALSPIHWETMLLSTNLAHSILPLALIAGLAFTRMIPASPARACLAGALAGLCIFTGFGLCVAPILVTLCIFQAFCARSPMERADALLTLLLLTIALGLFCIGYIWSPAIPGWSFPVKAWWGYGEFPAYMTATLLGLREKSTWALCAGGCLLFASIGVFGLCLRRLRTEANPRREAATVLLIGTGLVYMGMTTIGRLPAGIEAAFMWRYTTLSACMPLGLLLYLVGLPGSRSPRHDWPPRFAGLLLAGAVWINLQPDHAALTIARAKTKWVNAYIQCRDVTLANQQSGFWIYPPDAPPRKLTEKLRWLEQRHLSFFEPPSS